jgi:hypothetical protein
MNHINLVELNKKGQPIMHELTNDEINQAQNLLAKAATMYRALARDHYEPSSNDQIESAIGCEYLAKQCDKAIENLEGLRPEEPVFTEEIERRYVMDGHDLTYVWKHVYKDGEPYTSEIISWYHGDDPTTDYEGCSLKANMSMD